MGKLIERIDQAANDDKLFGIVLRLNEPTLGRGKVDELRAAIARARKAGKKVYADRAGNHGQPDICWPPPATKLSCRRRAC